MAFESVRKFKSVVKKVSSDVLLSMAISNDTPCKDGSVPRSIRFAVAAELMEKYRLYENRVDFLIDEENNLGMIRLDNHGMKVNIPHGASGSGKRGYVRLRLPEFLSGIDNISGYEITIVDFLNDAFVFDLPTKCEGKNSALF